MAKQELKRRNFLKGGFGLASVSLIPFELVSKPEKINTKSNKAEKILLKYGTEFGQVKPELGRKK